MKLLILYPQVYWERKMSSGRRDVIRHLIRPDRYHCHLSGQGWDDWDDAASIQDNINSTYPLADAILWYKPLGSVRDKVPAIRDPYARNIPAVAIYNEAYWPDDRAVNECTNSATDLVIYHHQADAERFCGLPAVHIPHCADPEIFVSAGRWWFQRTTPLLVTGTLNPDVYPLRTRVADLIAAGRLPGKVLPHPGYRLGSLQECDRQQMAYARELGNARHVFCCSSIYNYGLAKYVEAAQAGARVIGDVPPDFERSLGPHMVRVEYDASDDEIVRVIRSAIDHDLHWPALEGQKVAMEQHGVAGYCERLLGIIEGFIAGFLKGI
jgi:hypothetical protein